MDSCNSESEARRCGLGNRRVYGCVLHLDIKEGKIWIEQNMTEMRVAQELVAQGISKKDIVLGFRSPRVRKKIASIMANNQ